MLFDPSRLQPGPVLAATYWPTNAHLIEACAQLGYLAADRPTLDPTYGRGIWWKRWRPNRLATHDIRLDGVDFRDLPHADQEFGAVAFDPPYVSVGGRKTTTMPDFQNRYGIDTAPTTPTGVQLLINAGLEECCRVLEPNGWLLVKCQDYISSGRLQPGTHWTLERALQLGMIYFDRLEHIAIAPRPQPSRRRQVHARRNLSTLLVFRRPR